jgi:hypothetical protein
MLFLLACVTLSEGDYAVTYDAPLTDDCNLYENEPVRDDETVSVTRMGSDLRWTRESGEDLVWRVSGSTFTRESEGQIVLDAECGFITTNVDEGRATSSTSFEGRTTVDAVLEADCGTWTSVFGTNCHVEYAWEGRQ